MSKFNNEQIDQMQIRLMLATLICKKIVQQRSLSTEIFNDAKQFLETLKNEPLVEIAKIPQKPKKYFFSARKILTNTEKKWAGLVNGRDICRAKTERKAINLAKKIYLQKEVA